MIAEVFSIRSRRNWVQLDGVDKLKPDLAERITKQPRASVQINDSWFSRRHRSLVENRLSLLTSAVRRLIHEDNYLFAIAIPELDHIPFATYLIVVCAKNVFPYLGEKIGPGLCRWIV